MFQAGKRKTADYPSDFREKLVAHTGLEPVVSALRGQRVSRLHQCALADGIRGAAPRDPQVQRVKTGK